MQVLRKVCTNMEEIQIARNMQSEVGIQYANEHPSLRPVVEIPLAIYAKYTYSFHLRNLLNFYVENNPEGKPYGDIIITEAGVGLVRIDYDPLIYNQFEMFMSLGM
jgi:hypothetical protein